MMGTVGTGHTPHAGATLHALLGCVLLHILPAGVDLLQLGPAEQTRVGDADRGRSKAKQE